MTGPGPRENWDHVEPLFDRALDLEPEARRKFLDDIGERQPALRRRLDELLGAAEEIAVIIDRPLVEVASDLVDKVLVAELDSALEPGDWVGKYRILEELGGGGMGRVYLVQRLIKGKVETLALKILAKMCDSAALRRRFLRERQILQALRHDHIARLIDHGVTPASRPFFVLQFIDGQPIHTFCRERALTLETRVRLFVQIADAVDYAHREGIIHRDLKPTNLLVEEREDGSFHPYVLDFGVAHEDQTAELTATGEIIGTPAYMSPEQARADHRVLDHRSDIFSLGIVLYELIADRRLFEGPSVVEILQQLVETDAPALSEKALGVPEALEQITMTCLRRQPDERYPSVRRLIEELNRFLVGC